MCWAETAEKQVPVLSAPVLPERLWRRRELLCSAAKGRQSSSPEAMMDKTSVGQSHHRHSLRYFACLTSSISEAKACLRDEAVKQVRFVLENVCQLLCSLLSCPLLLLFKGEHWVQTTLLPFVLLFSNFCKKTVYPFHTIQSFCPLLNIQDRIDTLCSCFAKHNWTLSPNSHFWSVCVSLNCPFIASQRLLALLICEQAPC